MKLAIIGAASGQLPICLKAKEMGIETHCIAWPEGAVCKDVADYFHPLSIADRDKVVGLCRELRVEGVVSNASEFTAEVAAYVASELGLNGPDYHLIDSLHDKEYVRRLTSSVNGLSSPRFYLWKGKDEGIYPCVVKPCRGSSKSGVSYVSSPEGMAAAREYASADANEGILVEEYICGKEISVESISFKGHHHIIQITDKDSSSAPHFVELGHHQPAQMPSEMRLKIENIVAELLDKTGYTDGASHVELKYSGEKVFLIEMNLRGGGDDISNKLVLMSSGVDYLRCMIEVALGTFTQPIKTAPEAFSGIYYLCSQAAALLPFFESARQREWFVEGEIFSRSLRESHSNYERDGYLIYKSDHKIIP